MDIEELKCDISHVLQSKDYSILQVWTELCNTFCSIVSDKVKERYTYQEDCTLKKSEYSDKILELQQEINTVKSNIDDIILQQKVIDKQISDTLQSQDNIRDKLDKRTNQKDKLASEIFNLQLELDKRKQDKISKWNAIKRACSYYKGNLDIHIRVQEEKDLELITISFFMIKYPTKDKYFVQLSRNDNRWSVEQIIPKLKEKHFNELNIISDPSGKYKIPDITLFLCQVRTIFLKYYMQTI